MEMVLGAEEVETDPQEPSYALAVRRVGRIFSIHDCVQLAVRFQGIEVIAFPTAERPPPVPEHDDRLKHSTAKAAALPTPACAVRIKLAIRTLSTPLVIASEIALIFRKGVSFGFCDVRTLAANERAPWECLEERDRRD
jgi:hypothetical protein